MLALRQDMVESVWPFECAKCTDQMQAEFGCHGPAAAPITICVGGKSVHRELHLDRCPIAIMRDISSDLRADMDEAIRYAIALDKGAIDMGLETWTAVGLDAVYLAHGIMMSAQAERASAAVDR